eukprot:TRINITY_DN1173_c0_g1_i7.p1 TRINITY_DN1173_c0_g1~~TRINITY_DN1173_c0_g1_i7.p1  ORF type:complete len:246 (-),score=75.05 TRINITY_DN1173_c0_g1_i7:62-799(-)
MPFDEIVWFELGLKEDWMVGEVYVDYLRELMMRSDSDLRTILLNMVQRRAIEGRHALHGDAWVLIVQEMECGSSVETVDILSVAQELMSMDKGIDATMRKKAQLLETHRRWKKSMTMKELNGVRGSVGLFDDMYEGVAVRWLMRVLRQLSPVLLWQGLTNGSGRKEDFVAEGQRFSSTLNGMSVVFCTADRFWKGPLADGSTVQAILRAYVKMSKVVKPDDTQARARFLRILLSKAPLFHTALNC